MLYAENYKLYAYNDINDFNLVKDYLERCAIYKSEATIITSRYCLKSFYVFYISYLKSNGVECEEYLIKSVNIKTIETYIITLLNKKLSNNFIATKMMILKDYLKYLSKNNIIKTSLFLDIFDSVKIPRRTVKNQICRKSKEAIEFLENIKRDRFSDRRNILMIMLMSNTGIRRKEIAGINANAINLSERTITIYKTKGAKPRVISFSECVKTELINYLKERETILKKHNKKSDSLLIKKNGGDLNVNTISNIMKKLSKKYDFKITCHSLRRGFATDMAENNTDIYLISKMLGHENINTTVSRYIQVFSSAIKTAMQNHPLSKIESEEKKSEENKSPNSDKLNREEIILKINSLMEETNKLVKMLEKSA